MKTKIILRREWFGGLLARGGKGYPTLLDPKGYERAKKGLASRTLDAGHIRLVDAEEQGYPIRRDALATPGVAYAEITKRCDGACTHCYASATPKAPPDELTFSEWVGVFNRLADGGAYYVRLTGGEPTLREDLFDLLDLLAEKGMAVGLNSHGRFSERTLLRLLEHGVRDFRLSVDGTETIHDAIRGPGAFGDVVATLRRIAEHNRSAAFPADPTMNVVLMRSTRHCIAPLAEMAAELGCKISFGLLRPAGRASRKLMLAPDEVLEAAREVARLRRKLGLKEGQARINFDVFCDADCHPALLRPFPFDNSKCPIGTMGVGITATGRVTPCTFLGYMTDGQWLGESVREHDILDLWQTSRVLTAARRILRRSCADCVHYQTRCNGGCPATAYAFTGDADGRDPYCVRDVLENPASANRSAPRKVAVASLLQAIRTLAVSSDADWAEYSRAFVPDGTDDSQRDNDASPGAEDLAGRIKRGEGARPVQPDLAASPKIIRAEDLARLKAQQGMRLGVMSGAFDLLHPGHVTNLCYARNRLGSGPGTALCVLTLPDEAIGSKKGPTRPVLNLNERLALLAAVRWIDYVVPLDQPDCLRALELLKPEFFFKSPADLTQSSVRHESTLVARSGGALSFLPTHGPGAVSTTRLVGDERGHSPDKGLAAVTAFCASDSLRRLVHVAPLPDAVREFPEALYQAALQEIGLPRPPTWSGVKRAFLVTLDGPSGAGKDTHLRLLHQRLRHDERLRRPVLRLDLKRLNPFRLLLERLWESPEFKDQRELVFGLLTCARRYTLDAVLGQWLSDSQNVILQNRSFISQVAYHATSPPDLDHWLDLCAFDPQADLALLLDCDPTLAPGPLNQRSPERDHHFSPNEQPDPIARVQRNFALLQDRNLNLIRIETSRESESISEEVASIVEHKLSQEGIRA